MYYITYYYILNQMCLPSGDKVKTIFWQVYVETYNGYMKWLWFTLSRDFNMLTENSWLMRYESYCMTHKNDPESLSHLVCIQIQTSNPSKHFEFITGTRLISRVSTRSFRKKLTIIFEFQDPNRNVNLAGHPTYRYQHYSKP